MRPRRKLHGDDGRWPCGRQARLRRHSGFTLLELLLVLLLMAVIAGMTVPVFRNALANQHLRQAGGLVLGGLAKARVAAIRNGAPHQFCYTPNGAQYWLQAYQVDGTSTAGATSTLPKNALFAGSGRSGASLSERSGNSTATVTFFPDGTGQDASIALQNDRGHEVIVAVRGLTGMASLQASNGSPSAANGKKR